MKVAYLQSIGGVSGDMMLGVLASVGVDLNDIRNALSRLNIEGFSLEEEKTCRGGVYGTRVIVHVDDTIQKRGNLSEFKRITQESSLPRQVIDQSCSIFDRLKAAEETVHSSLDQTHNVYELGDLDTLIDVVGSVSGLYALGIECLYASPLPSGAGLVHTDHGVLPVPTPATAELIAMSGAPIIPPPVGVAETGEMVTPTGAAIVTTLAKFDRPVIKVGKVGYGLGARESSQYPNVLAMWVGEQSSAYVTGLVLIETNLDDASGEHLGFVQELLISKGAKDVWFTPVQMKKSRPGTMLSAIVSTELEREAIETIIAETPTLGVRIRPIERYEAEREQVEILTSIGLAKVKVKRMAGRIVAVSPEYEDCRTVAIELQLPLQEVYRVVQREAEDQLLDRAG